MARRRRRVNVAALMIIVSGALAFAQAPAAPLSRDWKRLRSEHFIVEGTGSVKSMRDWVAKLETFRASLAAVFPRTNFDSALPNKIIVLDSTRDFYPLLWRSDDGKTPTGVGGYFRSADDANYFVVNTASMEPEFVIYHEYTHLLFHQMISGPTPEWIREGFAEFFATFRVDEDERVGVLGATSPRILSLNVNRLLPLGKMMQFGGPALVADQIRGDEFYAQSWALVHYLMLGHGGKRDGQLLSYVMATASGKSADQAFSEAFRSTPQQLQLELGGYLRGRRFRARAIPLVAQSQGDVAAQPMFEWEVNLMRGRILTDNERLEEADKALAAADAAMPKHPDVSYAMAVLRRAQRRSSESIASLRALAAQAPDSFLTHLELARALADAHQHDLAIRSYQRALALDSRVASVWLDFSLSLTAVRLGSEADAAMARVMAIAFEPDWYRSRSLGAWRLGLDALAFSDAARFTRLAGFSDVSAPDAAILGVLAARRAHLKEGATELLNQLAASVKPGSWPATIVSFLQQRTESAALLGKAKGRVQLTEAHAYAGLVALIDGREADARPHLDWVLKEGVRNSPTYLLVLDATRK